MFLSLFNNIIIGLLSRILFNRLIKIALGYLSSY